jgi:thiamine-monophosphate kinase
MHNYPQLIKQHFMPIPHVEQGRAISRSKMATSMMDISDGLASDIRHISKASKLGAVLYEERFPHSEEFQKYLADLKPDYLKTAIGVGEDYCLLLTVPQKKFADLKKNLNELGHQLYNVGEMTEGDDIYIVSKKGEKSILTLSGWDQFKEH